MTAAIRLASQDDAGAIREIYAPFCDTSLISFEYAAPSTLEIASRVRNLATSFPWLILESQGVVAGYAYASRHHERAGYGWSVDVTVYISPSQHRRGAGRALYTTLFQLLRLKQCRVQSVRRYHVAERRKHRAARSHGLSAR